MARITVPIRVFPAIERGKLSGSVTIDGEELKARTLATEVIRRTTSAPSSAKIPLVNISQQYTNRWSGGETVIIKQDFSEGTTRIFEGHLMNVRELFSGYPGVQLECSDYGIEAYNNPVFKKVDTPTDIGQIAADLISEYLPSHTHASVNTATGVTATPIWQGKDLWECLKDLAVIYGNNKYDFYCDYDKDWNFFEKGTRVHGPTSGIAIVYGQNHRETNMERSFSKLMNKITVIGKSVDGVPLMATRSDPVGITDNWKKHEIIRDTNLTTQDEVNNKAQYILAIKSASPGRSGNVKADGLPGLIAGYKVMIFDPHNNMNGYFVATEVRHILSRGFTTDVAVYEDAPEDPRLVAMLKKIGENEQNSLDMENEHGMENTYSFAFDSDVKCNHDGTQTSQGFLTLIAGEASGTMLSDVLVASSDITECVLKMVGASDISYSLFYVSVDGGASWEEAAPNAKLSVAGTGKLLKVKVLLRTDAQNVNPQINALSVMYR